MASWNRIGLAAAGVLGLALVGWCARTPAVEVNAAEARASKLSVQVSTNGVVEPIEEARVRARLDGRIVEIPDPGAVVAAGELLLRIDGGPVESDLQAARSERLAALESLRSSRRTLERVQKRAATDRTLFDEGGLSPQAWRESQAELSEARARVAFLEREVPLRVSSLDLRIKELEARREASEVRAPFDGTVYKTAAKLGETVRIGDPVLWFADLERLRIRANVDQVDLGRVQVGQPVVITSNAYQERDWSARVTELIPHVTMKDSRFIAEGLASVEPPSAGLVPGMTVDVEILVDSDANALQVPSEAIFTDDGGSFVYRIDGDEVRATRVRIGRSTVETIEIVDGLEPHDRVVIGPVTGLSDGARVEARIRDVGSR